MSFVRIGAPRLLMAIVLLGLVLRVFFLFFGAPAFYHSPTGFYFNGDSSSYIQAFENWWRTGNYSFDFQEPDASVGRLPGYPFFYGFIRIIAGINNAPVAVAWLQILLDTGAILLVYGIVRRLAPQRAEGGLIGAFLYATYPFVIIWTPIMGTESLSTDLGLLWLYMLVNWRPTTIYALGVGVLIAVNLFVREYMAALLPATLFYLLIRERSGGLKTIVTTLTVVSMGFGALYMWWPIRNYYSLNRIILLKPRTAGYANFTPEVAEYNAWVHCWTNDETPWRDSILVGSSRIHFPSHAFPDAADAVRAHQLVAQARTCGSGYYVQRRSRTSNPISNKAASGLAKPDSAYQYVKDHNCNEITGAGFAELRARFVQAYPIRYWSVVPLQNLKKTFFKSATNSTQGGSQALVQRILFGYRSVLLLLGWAGLLLYLRTKPVLIAMGTFVAIIYVYMSFIMRGVEMRYLLQTDVLMLIPAALLLHRLLFLNRRLRSLA